MMSELSNWAETLTVASPCPENWAAMEGDEKRRYCGRCRLHVYNLSAMTSAEAAELVEQRSGRLCVRFVRTHDGKVMTTDCPHQAVSRRRRIFAGVSLLIVGLVGGTIWGTRREPRVATGMRRFRILQPVIDWLFPSQIMGDLCPSPAPRTNQGKSPTARPSGTRPTATSSPTP